MPSSGGAVGGRSRREARLAGGACPCKVQDRVAVLSQPPRSLGWEAGKRHSLSFEARRWLGLGKESFLTVAPLIRCSTAVRRSSGMGGVDAEKGEENLHCSSEYDVRGVHAQLGAPSHSLHGHDLEVDREGVLWGVVGLVPVRMEAGYERDQWEE